MSDNKSVLRLEAEPPLREGQFLQNPVLKRSQAVRALVIFAIAAGVISLFGLRPASAASSVPQAPWEATPLHAISGSATSPVLLAQVDLSRQRRAAAKKKSARKPSSQKSRKARTGDSSRSTAAFDAYIQKLWPQAQARGVSRAVFDRAFAGVTLSRAVLRPARQQAEFVKPIWGYLTGSVSPQRINKGRALARQYASVLSRIESRYGVDRYIVLSIWGMETSYGGYTGSQNVIRALTSLAFAGVREDFFRNELLTALVILQQGHISASRMTGSWAGAMGQTQFMPTSFVKYAVDHDGDGAKNIWTNIPDALASTANYLAKFGWQRGVTWGYEVTLPRTFNVSAHDPRVSRPFTYWSSAGVRRADGRPMPTASSAAIFLPAGIRGPAFLMTKNFAVIKEYNRSNAYALGVAHLSDRIAGTGPIKAAWPSKDRPLSKQNIMTIQRYLNRNGYNAGKVDGRVGQNVTEAIRQFQLKRGMVADGYPTHSLLRAMR